MQNESLILTCFDSFVCCQLPIVNQYKQLRLETSWLIMGGTYQINRLMDLLH